MTTDIVFPEWTPNSIRIYTKNISKLFDDHKLDLLKKRLDLYIKISTDEQMKKVWDLLQKRSPDVDISDNETGIEDWEVKDSLLEFADEVAFAYLNGLDSAWELIPPSEREAELNSLVTDLKKLSIKLEKFKISFDPDMHLTAQEKSTYVDDSSKKYKTIETLRHLNMYGKIPNLWEILSRVANEIKENPPHKYCLTTHTSNTLNNIEKLDVSKTYFMRRLVQFNLRAYGTPLYDIVARVTTVLYACSTTANTVRKSAKNMTRPKN